MLCQYRDSIPLPASVEILHQTLSLDPMSTGFCGRELLVMGKRRIKGQAESEEWRRYLNGPKVSSSSFYLEINSPCMCY